MLRLTTNISNTDTIINLSGKVAINDYIAVLNSNSIFEVIKVLTVSGNTITSCMRGVYMGVNLPFNANSIVYVLDTLSLADSNDIASIYDFGTVGLDDDALLDRLINSNNKYVSLSGADLNIFNSHTYNNFTGIVDLAGGSITQHTTDSNMLTFDTGSVSVINGLLNGNNKSPRPLQFLNVDKPVVNSITIQNGYSNTVQCNLLTLQNCNGGTIFRYFGNNAYSAPNSVLGDNLGSSRGLQIYRTTAATEWTIIDQIVCNNILGEEGDAIQILGYDGLVFVDMMIKAGLVMVTNANRRGLKIQGNKVYIDTFVHRNTLTSGELVNAVSVINVINSTNVEINNVDIDSSINFVGINITGTLSQPCNNVKVLGGNIKAGTSAGIFVSYAPGIDLSGIDINCGSGNGVAIQNTDTGCIEGLTFGGGTATTEVDINSVSNNNKLVIRNNKRLSGTRGYIVRNTAPNCIVTDNLSMANGCIDTAATATGGVIKRNICKGGVSVVNGITTGQLVADNDLV